MNKVFENIIIHYNYVWERYVGRVITTGTLGGAIYVGTVPSKGPEKPKFGDTVLLATYGAVAGAFGSILLLASYPVAIPVAAFIGPIHLYNEYKYESRQPKDKHELK